MKSDKIIYVLIFLVLIWYHCFGYVGVAAYSYIFNGLCYIITPILLLSAFKEISFKKHGVPTLILYSTIISMFTSMVLWGQDLTDTIKGFRTYYLVLVFFFLFSKKADTGKVEKALVVIALIYVLCWLYQVVSVPTLVFGMDRDDNLGSMDARGFYRFWIPTKENMPILVLFFYELYRRTKKRIYIALVSICFLIVVLHVGRQMMFWSFLSLVLFILYSNRRKWRMIVLSAVVVYMLFVVMVDNIPTLNLLFEQTQTQVDSGSDDIRAQAISFYWQESLKNPIGFLFGNGIGYGGALSNFTAKATKNGFYESDIGYFALLFDFGILGVLSYVLLLWQVLKMKVDDRYVYLKCYLIYVYGSYTLAHCLTTNIFFNMCVIYILYRSNKVVIRNATLQTNFICKK